MAAIRTEERAQRLAEEMRARGFTVSRVIIEGRRFEVVIDDGKERDPFELVDMKR